MFLNLPPRLTRTCPAIGAIACLLLLSFPDLASAVEGISSNAMQQISALIAEKSSRTAAQLKMDSQLLYALRASRGQPVAPGMNTLQFLPVSTNGLVKVDLDCTVSSNLLAFITGSGGQIISSVPRFDAIRAL